MVLHEKSVPYTHIETNPFDETGPNPHPFGRVPLLTHGDFTLYETRAITHYINGAFSGPNLCPTDCRARAQLEQVLSILDNYAYWPLVRQVFSQRIFAPFLGDTSNKAEIAAGLAAAQPVLRELDSIAAQGHILAGPNLSLADCHAAPILAYFDAAPEGRAALKQVPTLAARLATITQYPSFIAAHPPLSV
jgi:glutathione S-transferase